ncbi:MAG: carboxypeptidase regulatory-like domain-containing protein [Clostridia bacterium]|nr:carboxypeptidase regulatory-like domain-containing protein [Clostridia bacterium]
MLAATATLSFVMLGSGCGVKDWFDEKLNEDNRTESVIETPAETTEIFASVDGNAVTTSEIYADGTFVFTVAANEGADASATVAITSKPETSVSATVSDVEGVYTFTPDVVGEYVLTITSTAAKDVSSTLTITVKEVPAIETILDGRFINVHRSEKDSLILMIMWDSQIVIAQTFTDQYSEAELFSFTYDETTKEIALTHQAAPEGSDVASAEGVLNSLTLNADYTLSVVYDHGLRSDKLEVFVECECEDEGNFVVYPQIDATCTTNGRTERTYCTICKMWTEMPSVIAATGHDFITVEAAVAPTCTTNGKTARIACSRCGEVSAESQVVQALGHTPIDVAEKAPTCTETGVTAGSKCSVCSEVLSGLTEIPKHDRVDSDNDNICDDCGNVDFSFYQNTANYSEESYTAWNALSGNIARLHVATTADDGTVTDNSFAWVVSGTISFTYDREKDAFRYTHTGYANRDNDGSFGDYYITHDDLQYFAFEVDGEYYVDVYFDANVKLNLCAGFNGDANGENLQPVYVKYNLGSCNFPDSGGGAENTVLLKVKLD